MKVTALFGSTRRIFLLSLLIVGLIQAAIVPAANAGPITIRSWDTANERGGDLATGGGGDFDYGDFRTALLANGDTILSGLSTLSAAGLAGVDAFFWGTSSHVLSAAEAAALLAFVSGGGTLIIETNSDLNEQAAANSGYSALGLGNRISGALGNGGNSSTAGTFALTTTAATLGGFGDVRGNSFASSLAAIVTPTGATSVGFYGSTSPNTTWVEFAVGSGRVLGVGDPYGFGLFWTGGGFFNDNNRVGYMNFLHPSQAVIPEPTTLALLGGGLLAGVRRLRRRK